MRFQALGLIGGLSAVLGLVVGCGSDSSSGDTDAGGTGGGSAGNAGMSSAGTTNPPDPTKGPICIISADCPSGTHCDLGECIQDCNADNACADRKTCSARARCLGDGE